MTTLLALEPAMWLGLIGAALLLFLFFVAFAVARYKRCPSNMILVKYGNVGTAKAAKCIHGGATFVWPLIQDYGYLRLEPMVIEIPLEGALFEMLAGLRARDGMRQGDTSPPVRRATTVNLLRFFPQSLGTQVASGRTARRFHPPARCPHEKEIT